jgi:polyhydroxybutyrate depolymerase
MTKSVLLLTWYFLALLASPSVWAAALPPGDFQFDLPVGGKVRNYLVHLPPQATAGPLPVVLSLHGGGGHAQQHRQSSGMDAAADRDGYIAVYPNGSGILGNRLLTWNAGNCCSYAMDRRIDDVAFISALIDDLARRANIDLRRIYVTGHSNGSMMAERLGEELPDKFAAVAGVAGVHVPAIRAARAVPLLHIHSVDDPRALYSGGLGPPFPMTNNRVLHQSVNEMMAAWVKNNGCSASPEEKQFKEAGGHTARLLVYAHCRDGAEVALWKLTVAGHGWPGAKPAFEKLLGPATTVIDANTEVWRFFSRFTLAR